ncbi:hypothetical protein LR48_Vigan03g148000 [Vigna angularis]|uniref:Uncharacterized protein n=1 Tax=Phaseolus angularis TaxID=3914 RepID=A0A0L9U5J4_PHAAN|nr:hypothetical protein LR48_Vigan03g148000 [Vigna angularis]
MEGRKQMGSSSFTSELFGSNQSHKSSATGIFESMFSPPSKVLGRESLRSEASEKTANHISQESGGETQNTAHKDISSIYHEEKVQPCQLSSSIHYGGQDIYSRPKSSQDSEFSSLMYKKDGVEDDSESASRGNWWQDYLSKMDPSKSSTFARLFAQSGGDIRKTGGSSSFPVQKAPPPPPAVDVPPPNSPRHPVDTAPLSESIPKKKNKRKVVRESFAESKRAKRILPDGLPLSGSLSANTWVAKRIHFDLFTEEQALVNGMTEEEASDMAIELAARSTMCLAYATQKRASASTDLQALREKFDVAIKSNEDLTLRLAETERMAEEDKKKANTLLAEARATQRQRDSLLAERDSLQDRVTKLEADNKLPGDEVVNEHLLGFDKVFAQCNLLFQVPTNDPRLDVRMMVMDDKLVPIHVPPPSSPAVPNVEAAAEVVADTDEADIEP